MQTITRLIDNFCRLLLRVVMFIVAAGLAVILFCVALVVVAFVLLRALLTGRKPQVFTTFSRFHQTSQQFAFGRWQTTRTEQDTAQTSGTVIEGQATEVRDDPALPDK